MMPCSPMFWVVATLVWKVCVASSGTCPSVCICKWKSGKQTVECMDRALITIPEGIDQETQVLNMSGNNLQILSREMFLRAGLVNLQRVFLRSCRIGQIDDLAFSGITNLIELDLSHNLLTSIPSGTFRDIPFLRDLILSHNPIQKVDGRAFKGAPGLVKLDLSECELQMVAPMAFEGLELHELKLSGNRLSELRVQTVETLGKLHGIELQDNPWHCDCKMRPVKEWVMQNKIPLGISPVCSGGPERVIDKAFSDLHLDDFACKPDMLPMRRYVEASAGDNVTIVCKANSVPAPHINWYWNGRPLINNSAFSTHQRIFIFEDGGFQKHSRLVLTNAQETDSTEFYCVAENRAGNAEANFTVRVSMRAVGMVTLGSGQIAGLSAALVILILFVLLVILVLLVRLRRIPFSESKTPGQIEVVTVVNPTVHNGKAAVSPATPVVVNITSSFTERKPPADLNFCNPVQKPPRLSSELPSYAAADPGSSFVSPSPGSGNNPDLINDTKTFEGEEPCYGGRPASGEYSRNIDSLYPSGLWEHGESEASYSRLANPTFQYDDKTPIMEVVGSEEDLHYRNFTGYPSDYGLPIVEQQKVAVPTSAASQVNLPTNAKTLRVWQKGGVPVLPPVTALKRALTHSRNSPDEGYQEGCGTDV